MKKITLIALLLMGIKMGYSASIVCYSYNNSCFYTNYNCGDFSGCTTDPNNSSAGCYCNQLAGIITAFDEDKNEIDFRISGNELQVETSGGSWIDLLDLSTTLANGEVFSVKYVSSLDYVVLDIYKSSVMSNGGSAADAYLRETKIFYIAS
jgi:hypothetical protein